MLLKKEKLKLILMHGWQIFFSTRPANDELFKLMKKGTAEAKASGLTLNKLEELLNDNE